MTVNDFIKELSNLNPKLKEKKIVISTPNGLLVSPKVKQVLKESYIFGGYDNIDAMIITIE